MGTASMNWLITSGGVTMAAMTNAITMKYDRKFLSLAIVTMPSRTKTISTTGVSNDRPNTKNSVITKLRYLSMSVAICTPAGV